MMARRHIPPVFRALGKICEDHPLREKVLICGSYRSGYQLLRSLARTGYPWVNFRPVTVLSLAMDLFEAELVKRRLAVLSDTGMGIIVEDIFTSLAARGELRYFRERSVNKGLLQVLTNAMREIRMAGLTSSTLPAEAFINEDKAADASSILAGYESRLAEGAFLDLAGLLLMVMDGSGEELFRRDAKHVILSRDYRIGLERDFIERLAGKELVVLNEGTAEGLEAPRGCWAPTVSFEEKECRTDTERLRWLFRSAKAPRAKGDGTIRLFHACGMRDELREVLRRMVSSGIRFDEAEIVCSREDEYVTLIHATCEKLGIPVTFARGMPARFISAARALTGFLLWLKHDMPEKQLRRLLSSGDVKLATSGATGPGQLARALRGTGVGWGRERYEDVISKRIEQLRERLAGQEGDDKDRLMHVLESLERLRDFCRELLDIVPVADGTGDVSSTEICKACDDFMERYAACPGEADRRFVLLMREQLNLMRDLTCVRAPLAEYADKMLNLISTIRVESGQAQPGCLYVTDFRSGGASGRPHIFLLGLDERRFPALRTQDPVLLDEERLKISGSLCLSGETTRRELYDMAGFLSGLRGTLTASYAAYDVVQERAVFPSSVFLQLFRIAEGRPEADYNKLFEYLKEPVAGTPPEGEELDGTEWWLARLAGYGLFRDATGSVCKLYPGTGKGLFARQERESELLTEYDGKIEPREELDPRRSGKVISSSSLETAAKCPYGYFLQYVLGIKKPEDMEKDLNVWLDPLQRGSLLHEVYQLFVEKTSGNDEQDGEALKRVLFDELEKCVQRYRCLVPVPSEIVFMNENEQLKRDMEFFLGIQTELGTRPVMAEKRFGMAGEPPARVALGDGGELSVKGIIDRVDHAGGREYHVWDYKTGGSYAYNARGYVAGGEQLQHVIYAEVAKQILRRDGNKNAEVTRSGYLLPTEKGAWGGKGIVFARDPRERERWEGALARLLDVIARGVFFMGRSSARSCGICDFGEICKDGPELFRNKAPDKNSVLKIWEELKSYE